MVFKNFLYDFYSKDLSKKVISAKKSKARRGEYLGRAPIGYVRSETKKNQLEIGPEGAKIVRFIFDMALQGHTIPEIDNKKIAYRPLFPELSTTSVIAWKRQQPFSAAAEKFIQHIKCFLSMS